MLYTYALSYVHNVIKWEKADPEIRNVLLKSGRMVALFFESINTHDDDNDDN